VTCSYALTTVGLPPCLVFTHKTYRNLPNFLSQLEPEKSKHELLTDEINCISFNKSSKKISVLNDNCISCGSCAFGCPGGKINFIDGVLASPQCSSFGGASNIEINKIHSEIIDFTGNSLSNSNETYRSFEKFTGVKETTNIAVWGGNATKFLFGKEAKIGLEIPLTISGRDRNGRLDICVLTENTLIVIEAKIGLKKLIAEGRYEAQMLAYDEELTALQLQKKHKLFSIKLLLIGDDETDLLPQNHELCTSKVGNLSQVFYKSILKHRIQFITARGLLSLAMSKFTNPKISASNVFLNAFKDPATVGLLSNTLVKRRGDQVYLESLKL
jgi:NAD-dependent dihydropyrimidine dehydrogenase PreA subunit